MDIIISNSSGQPIYEQICRQIKGAVATGRLKPGEALPSIRALARDLRISVITTKRAYEELERDGYIYTVAGKGCFVSEQDLELQKEAGLREITKPDFRPCSTCLSRSQARLCLYTLRMISNHSERTFGRLRYLLGGDRPSQTAHLTLSPSTFSAAG